MSENLEIKSIIRGPYTPDEKIELIQSQLSDVAEREKQYIDIICDQYDELSDLKAENERKRQIIIAIQNNVGCGEPPWFEVEDMIEADARIIAELQEPVVIDLTLKE